MKRTVSALLMIAMLLALCACGTAKTEAPEASSFEITLFVTNDDADGFITTDTSISSLDAQSIIDALIDAQAIPEGIKANSMSFTEDGFAKTVVLDLNSEFQQALLGQGTAGETMRLYSVVNTFLAAFDAQKITITVDGEVLETGHSIYDQPLEKFA